MRSSACASIIGHLGADADLRFLPSGEPVLRFSIAHTPPAPDGQDERIPNLPLYADRP
jgi:single-stranded DNA-binding protein